jgi:hypothetical protein
VKKAGTKTKRRRAVRGCGRRTAFKEHRPLQRKLITSPKTIVRVAGIGGIASSLGARGLRRILRRGCRALIRYDHARMLRDVADNGLDKLYPVRYIWP